MGPQMRLVLEGFELCRALKHTGLNFGKEGRKKKSSEGWSRSEPCYLTIRTFFLADLHEAISLYERVTEQALARLKEIEGTIGAAGQEEDAIASELVRQTKKHTEQLTNVTRSVFPFLTPAVSLPGCLLLSIFPSFSISSIRLSNS